MRGYVDLDDYRGLGQVFESNYGQRCYAVECVDFGLYEVWVHK